MKVKTIRSENDAKWAISRIDELISNNNLSFEQEEELNILSILLSAWEDQYFVVEMNQYNDLPGMIKFYDGSTRIHQTNRYYSDHFRQ